MPFTLFMPFRKFFWCVLDLILTKQSQLNDLS